MRPTILLLSICLLSTFSGGISQDFSHCRETLLNNGIVLGKENIFFLKASFPEINYAWEDNKFFTYIKRLVLTLKQQSTDLVIVPVPPRPVVLNAYLDLLNQQEIQYDYKINEQAYFNFVEQLNKHGVFAVDVLTPLQKFDLSISESLPNLKNENHWSQEGARLSAKAVAELVQQIPLYDSLPKTRVNLAFGENSSETRFVAEKIFKLCGTKPSPDSLKAYEVAFEKSEDDREDLLFGEDKIYVVLVGTSYSHPILAFNAFLSESLKLEVLTLPISGGGIFEALEEYFIHNGYQDNKPKFLIWEFPFIYMARITTDQFVNYLRQIIPSIYGPCDEGYSVINNTVDLEEFSSSREPLNLPDIKLWHLNKGSIAPLDEEGNGYTIIPDGQRPFSRLRYALNTKALLAGKTFSFSAWFWTEEEYSQEEYKRVALRLRSSGFDRSRVITISHEPKLYSLITTVPASAKGKTLHFIIDNLDLVTGLLVKDAHANELSPYTVLNNSDKLPIQSSNYYLYLNFSDLSIVNYEISIKHEDGTQDTLPINRSPLIVNNGQFFLEFLDHSNVLDVSLTLPEAIQGKLDTYICRVM